MGEISLIQIFSLFSRNVPHNPIFKNNKLLFNRENVDVSFVRNLRTRKLENNSINSIKNRKINTSPNPSPFEGFVEPKHIREGVLVKSFAFTVAVSRSDYSKDQELKFTGSYLTVLSGHIFWMYHFRIRKNQIQSNPGPQEFHKIFLVQKESRLFTGKRQCTGKTLI